MKQMRFHTDKYMTLDAILASLGILFGYIEALLIPNLFFPGIKLGVSNIVVLFALLTLRKKDAFVIAVIKVLVNGLLFASLTSWIYSLSGTMLSVGIMCLVLEFYKRAKLSAVGVSVLGSMMFNLGQLLAASAVLGSFLPMYYLNYYLIMSVILGAITGIVTQIIVNKGVVKHNEKK